MPPKSGYGRYPESVHFVTSTAQLKEIADWADLKGVSLGEAIRQLIEFGLSSGVRPVSV